MTRTVRAALAALALVAATVVFAPTTATAAAGPTTCGGVYQGSRDLAGKATLDVYLENGTTNCLRLRTYGDAYGKASWMGIGIGGVSSVNYCNYPQTINEGRVVCGSYHYYVSGARIYAPHSCITMWASVVVNGVQYSNSWVNQFCS